MNPNTRFSVTLLVSLALWSTTMLAALRGDIDIAVAGVRYLVAFAVAWLGVGMFSALVHAYEPDDVDDDEDAAGDPEGFDAAHSNHPVFEDDTRAPFDPSNPQRRQNDPADDPALPAPFDGPA